MPEVAQNFLINWFIMPFLDGARLIKYAVEHIMVAHCEYPSFSQTAGGDTSLSLYRLVSKSIERSRTMRTMQSTASHFYSIILILLLPDSALVSHYKSLAYHRLVARKG